MGEAFDRWLGTLTKAELEALVARLPPCDPEEDPTTWTKEQWLAYQRGAATGGRVCDEAMILSGSARINGRVCSDAGARPRSRPA